MRVSAVLAFVLAVSVGAPVLRAADDTGNPLAENWYTVQPWAEQPPVDVYRRVAAIQSALGGLQNSVNAYSSALHSWADTQNRKVFLQAELARVEAAQEKKYEPRRSNFKTRGTPEEIDAAMRARPLEVGNTFADPGVGYTGLNYTELQAYELGVTTALQAQASQGWGKALSNHVMMNAPK